MLLLEQDTTIKGQVHTNAMYGNFMYKHATQYAVRLNLFLFSELQH